MQPRPPGHECLGGSPVPTRRGHQDMDRDQPRYKWIALSNTTLGVLMVMVNSSIVIISLPAIFRGIGLDPLAPGNVSYLLWMLMGYLLVSAVLVAMFGRLGDMFGRVRIYNLGSVVFAAAAIALSLDPLHSAAGAIWLIAWRLVQGVGGAMLMANSAAILTDAFSARQRGMALGINQVAAIAGSFLGLVIGGLLSEWDWRAVFWVSVPLGILGSIWAFRSLHEIGERRKSRLDLAGTITFALGLTALLCGITYGIQPYGHSSTGWTNPWLLAVVTLGVALLGVFCLIETKVAAPMFHLKLFRDRAFGLGNLASLTASVGRGGLQFMLIVWLQGVWLPLHGYDYEATPLWSGIYLLPLTVGFLTAGPISGWLADRYGARLLATSGLLVATTTFILLLAIPVDFSYWTFAGIILLNGIGFGMFSSPNTAAIMSSVPAHQRGAASGMRSTLFNCGTALSVGIFFSLMITGLSGKMPGAITSGLTQYGVPTDAARTVANVPPVGSLFAAFLGVNPIQQLLGHTSVLTKPGVDAGHLIGREFFPHLISAPVHSGLIVVFAAAATMTLIGALATWCAGERRYATDDLDDQGRPDYSCNERIYSVSTDLDPVPDGLPAADAEDARR